MVQRLQGCRRGSRPADARWADEITQIRAIDRSL
jgi:hypothetical protein